MAGECGYSLHLRRAARGCHCPFPACPPTVDKPWRRCRTRGKGWLCPTSAFRHQGSGWTRGRYDVLPPVTTPPHRGHARTVPIRPLMYSLFTHTLQSPWLVLDSPGQAGARGPVWCYDPAGVTGKRRGTDQAPLPTDSLDRSAAVHRETNSSRILRPGGGMCRQRP